MSLGGSVLYSGHEFNTNYVIQLADLLHDRADSFQQRTAIVIGGGWITRMYQEALRRAGVTNKKALDTIGILTTHMNARVVADILNARSVRTQYLEKLSDGRDPTAWVWITGGNVIGQNTDGTLVDWVQILGFNPTLINVTNMPFVYKLKPSGQLDLTKPIRNMTWHQYSQMVGPHEAGEHLPWGSTATTKARALGFRVITVGPNLDNLKAVFEGKPFKGTIIHP